MDVQIPIRLVQPCKNTLLDSKGNFQVTEFGNGWFGIFCYCHGVLSTKNPEEFFNKNKPE